MLCLPSLLPHRQHNLAPNTYHPSPFLGILSLQGFVTSTSEITIPALKISDCVVFPKANSKWKFCLSTNYDDIDQLQKRGKVCAVCTTEFIWSKKSPLRQWKSSQAVKVLSGRVRINYSLMHPPPPHPLTGDQEGKGKQNYYIFVAIILYSTHSFTFLVCDLHSFLL